MIISYEDYYQDPRSSHVEIQKISSVESNINVNGIDVIQITTSPLVWDESSAKVVEITSKYTK
jgi:hypothetical protein